MRVEGREPLAQGGIASPKVSPESRRSSIANRDFGDRAKNPEASSNIFPNGGIEVMRVTKVPGVIPAILSTEPGSPGGSGVRVEFREELRQEGRVLSPDGEDAQTTKFLWGADIPPGDFAVSTMTSFLSGPEEGPSPFVDGLNNPGREKGSSHGMGEHGREDRIYQNESSPNGEASTAPPRKAHATFVNNVGEISRAELSNIC
jgi:hypothetical protein